MLMHPGLFDQSNGQIHPHRLVWKSDKSGQCQPKQAEVFCCTFQKGSIIHFSWSQTVVFLKRSLFLANASLFFILERETSPSNLASGQVTVQLSFLCLSHLLFLCILDKKRHKLLVFVRGSCGNLKSDKTCVIMSTVLVVGGHKRASDFSAGWGVKNAWWPGMLSKRSIQ